MLLKTQNRFLQQALLPFDIVKGGVGVRIQSPESKFKYDIILGYQALMLNPRPQGGQYQYNGQDVNFKKVNQSVFIGLGLSF